jgi:hypothetical protein
MDNKNTITENNTIYDSNNSTDEPTATNNILIILLPIKIFSIIATVFLNLVIILVIGVIIKKKTYTNCLFLSRAVADLLVGCISFSSMTIFTTKGFWPLGYLACIFWVINGYSCCNISLCNLVLVTVQRLRQIVTPTKTNEVMTKMRIAISLSIWLVSYGSWAISVLLITKEDFIPENCYFTFTFAYVLSADIFAYIMPITVLVVLNVLTFRALHNKANKFGKKDKTFMNNQVHSLTVSNKTKRARISTSIERNEESIRGNFSLSLNTTAIANTSLKNSSTRHNSRCISVAQNSKSQISKEKKALICIAVILATTILCWCIFMVAWPVSAYCPTCVNAVLYEVGYWTAYFNSTFNPIILLIFHQKFRDELVKATSAFFSCFKPRQ